MKNILLLLFFTTWACTTAQYDINDPRNPNCPCHKYQKIADEEYKKLLTKANDNSVQQIAIKDNNETLDNPANEKSGVKRIKKRRNAGFNILKRNYLQKQKKTNKHKKLFRRKKSNNDCFSWK